MAQHRFAALMALWFFGSLVGGAVTWKTTGYSVPFLFAAGVLVFAALQLPIQKKLVTWVKGLPTPGWLNFLVTALAVSVAYGLVHVAILTLPFAWLASVSFWLHHFFDDLSSWWPSEALILSTWYAAWWAVLRIGWLQVSAGLFAAGIQYAIVKWVVLIHLEPTDWLLLAPVHFFAGWFLLFLPGAVVAHAYVPTQDGPGWLVKRILACTVPAIAAVSPFLVFLWFH